MKEEKTLFNADEKFVVLNIPNRNFLAINYDYYNENSFKETYDILINIINCYSDFKNTFIERLLYVEDGFFKPNSTDIKAILMIEINENVKNEEIENILNKNKNLYKMTYKEDMALKMVMDKNLSLEKNLDIFREYLDENDYMDSVYFAKGMKHHNIYLGDIDDTNTKTLIIHSIYNKIHFG